MVSDLENFRRESLNITAANMLVDRPVIAKVGDADGRTLRIKITDGGADTDLTGSRVYLCWAHESLKWKGVEAFTPVDEATGTYEVAYPAAMKHAGRCAAYVSIVQGDRVINSRNFTLYVESDLGIEEQLETSGTFESLMQAIDAFKRLTETAQATIDDWVSQLEAHKKEHDDQMAAQQTAFDDAQTQRTDDFNTAQTERDTAFNNKVAELEGDFNEKLQAFQTTFDGKVAEWQKKADALVDGKDGRSIWLTDADCSGGTVPQNQLYGYEAGSATAKTGDVVMTYADNTIKVYRVTSADDTNVTITLNGSIAAAEGGPSAWASFVAESGGKIPLNSLQGASSGKKPKNGDMIVYAGEANGVGTVAIYTVTGVDDTSVSVATPDKINTVSMDTLLSFVIGKVPSSTIGVSGSLDDIITPGFYAPIPRGTTGLPSGIEWRNCNCLTVWSNTQTLYVNHDGTNEIWMRTRVGSVWNTWQMAGGNVVVSGTISSSASASGSSAMLTIENTPLSGSIYNACITMDAIVYLANEATLTFAFPGWTLLAPTPYSKLIAYEGNNATEPQGSGSLKAVNVTRAVNNEVTVGNASSGENIVFGSFNCTVQKG